MDRCTFRDLAEPPRRCPPTAATSPDSFFAREKFDVPISPVRRALLTLAVGGFAIGTGEFVMLGLLPQVAADLSVSIPRAGELIAAYALGVVVGAPLLTAASVRYPRKHVLIFLMSWFAVGNFVSAVAPTFGLVMLARFATGLPHGAFFGAGAVVAGSLVHRSRATSAMSVMFAGLTVANIIGVPATTMLGQHTSWRLVYALVGVSALVAVALIAWAVPKEHAAVQDGALRAELRAFANPQVWMVLGVAMLGGGGLFATFSYIAPMMTQLAGFTDTAVTWLLVLFGLGMTVGNLVGGRLADRYPGPTLLLTLVAEIVLAVAFIFAAHDKIASLAIVFLFPAAALGGLPSLQGRVIALAGGAPNLAAASIQAAFNIANSLGAYLGGLAIASGYGYSSPNFVAAVLVALGLALALVLTRMQRRSQMPAVDAPPISAQSDQRGEPVPANR
jgi:DHA1 family inner membrane transport protein